MKRPVPLVRWSSPDVKQFLILFQILLKVFYCLPCQSHYMLYRIRCPKKTPVNTRLPSDEWPKVVIQFLCIYRIVFCFVLFILCSIWFRFISILGPLRRLKKNNFWCSHQMSHYICDESFLRWRYQDESFFYLNMSSWSSSFSFPFIWSSWTWVWCCNWNWGFGNSFLGFTHFFTDIFGCWSFRLNISN